MFLFRLHLALCYTLAACNGQGVCYIERMTTSPEQHPGVGETAFDEQFGAFARYAATDGLKAVKLAAADLRQLNQRNPEETHLPARVFQLQQLEAHLYALLIAAGFTPDEIKMLPSSEIHSEDDA